ncbi:MAG TPA: type VII secretion integral membrane protein EccD [Micromonosporaceae bacterium]|nr:type VII secretion integral membrane protein EccD [Micromonosporaceae bacterium]
MPAPSTGLSRVTVSSPQRRVDVALPHGVPLAELLPEILRHAGEGLADDGEQHGGWLLRRADGTALSPASGLAAQEVRDGAVLNLVPARASWPELEYDDVVEAIASGARRHGVGWSPRASRITGVVGAGVILALGLIAVLRSGPAWTGPGLAALAVAAVLTIVGVLAARAYGDAAVGAALATYALPYAFVGGLLVLAPDRPLTGMPAGDLSSCLLTGAVALLLCSVVAAVGVAYALRVFVAGGSAGALGGAAVLLSFATAGSGAAAVLLTLLVTGVAAIPLLAIRFGKLPLPVLTLPTDLAGSVESLEPGPDRARVAAAVARTDEMLTGLLTGLAVLAGAAAPVLAGAGLAGPLLVGVAATAFLLRARLFVTVRQRLPLLAAGVAGFAVLGLGRALTGAGVGNLGIALGAAAAGLVVALAGARYATRAPSPYLGRAADVLDALCVVATVPVACAVLGLYSMVQQIGG